MSLIFKRYVTLTSGCEIGLDVHPAILCNRKTPSSSRNEVKHEKLLKLSFFGNLNGQ